MPAMLAAVLMFFLVLFLRHRLVNPKVPRTPAPVWHGAGVLRTQSGAAYPLYLKLRFERKHEGAAPIDGRTNFIGTANLCGMNGATYDLEVSGAIDSWWAQNGKPVVLYLRTERNSGATRFFILYGFWQGAYLVLDDRGSLSQFFAADSLATNALSDKAPHAKQIFDVTMRYAEKADFDALCPASSPSTE